MSGCADWSHSSTRGSRTFNELTFQVAMHTRSGLQVSRVGDEQLRADGFAHVCDHLRRACVGGPVAAPRGELFVEPVEPGFVKGFVAEQLTEPLSLGLVECRTL